MGSFPETKNDPVLPQTCFPCCFALRYCSLCAHATITQYSFFLGKSPGDEVVTQYSPRPKTNLYKLQYKKEITADSALHSKRPKKLCLIRRFIVLLLSYYWRKGFARRGRRHIQVLFPRLTSTRRLGQTPFPPLLNVHLKFCCPKSHCIPGGILTCTYVKMSTVSTQFTAFKTW